MSKVLIVTGTGGSFDTIDLRDDLRKRNIECEEAFWNGIRVSHGKYDLAVLFGLDDRERNRADLFASTVRKAIGPHTKFLIISKWDRLLIDEQHMKEKYDAEYLSRHSFRKDVLDAVLKLLQEKTAS